MPLAVDRLHTAATSKSSICSLTRSRVRVWHLCCNRRCLVESREGVMDRAPQRHYTLSLTMWKAEPMPDVRASVRLQSPADLLIWRQAYSGARYRGTAWLSSMAGTDRPSRRVSVRIVKLPSCAWATHAGFNALVPLRFSSRSMLRLAIALLSMPCLCHKSRLAYTVYMYSI